jgi:hypothetical protein
VPRVAALAAILTCFCTFAAAQASLNIVEDSLPPLTTGMQYHVQLHATGLAPPFVWSVVEGDLPDGISLSPDGVLSGRPTKPGGYNFILKVDDSGHPPHSATKQFFPSVSTALLLDWLETPKVRDGRIDGSVQVSNGSPDTFDLTVVIVAVATADQRATAIGYERFPLKPGATNIPIIFGNTLPHGGYVIHADAIAEIPARNVILRQRLQSPNALQIAVGP